MPHDDDDREPAKAVQRGHAAVDRARRDSGAQWRSGLWPESRIASEITPAAGTLLHQGALRPPGLRNGRRTTPSRALRAVAAWRSLGERVTGTRHVLMLNGRAQVASREGVKELIR